MSHDNGLYDPDPDAMRRRRYSIRRSVAMSEYMFRQIREIAALNDMKPGIIMRKALNRGLPLVRDTELAARDRQRRPR